MLRHLVLMLSLVGFFYGCSSDDGDKKTPAGNTSNIPAELKRLATLTNNFAFGATNLFNDANLIDILSAPAAPRENYNVGVACPNGGAAGTANHTHDATAGTHNVEIKDACFIGSIKINGTIHVPIVAPASGFTIDLSINVANSTLKVTGAKFTIVVTPETGVVILSSVGKFTVTDGNNVSYEVENLVVTATPNDIGATLVVAGTVIDKAHGPFTIASAGLGLTTNGLSTGGTFTLTNTTNTTNSQTLVITYAADGGYIIALNGTTI